MINNTMETTIYHLPNDMIIEIANKLPTKDLIQLYTINKTFNGIITYTLWPRTTTIKRYLCKGFKFNTFQLKINPYIYHVNAFKKVNRQVLSALNSHCEITVKYATIDADLLKYLGAVRKVTFVVCTGADLDEDDYHLLDGVESISFKYCDLPFTYLVNFKIDLYKPKYITEDMIPYLAGANKLDLTFCSTGNIGESQFDNIYGMWRYKFYKPEPNVMADLKKLFIFGKGIVSHDELICYKNIETLCLSETDVTDRSLGYLVNLRKLILCECPGITANGIHHLTKLVKLNLDQAYNVRGDIFKHLPNLEYLDASGSDITNHNLQYLTNVRKLYLNDCANITDAGLIYLAKVTTLSLAHCKQITGSGFQHLTSIVKLDIGCCDITDDKLVYLSRVRNLVLSNCNYIIGTGFVHLRRVRKLNISKCTNIRIDSFKHLRRVKDLNLSYSAITDTHLQYLSKVRVLNLAGCDKVTDQGIIKLNSVESLDITNCRNITDKSLSALPMLKKIEPKIN